jgi:hypothetical protein
MSSACPPGKNLPPWNYGGPMELPRVQPSNPLRPFPACNLVLRQGSTDTENAASSRLRLKFSFSSRKVRQPYSAPFLIISFYLEAPRLCSFMTALGCLET